jgi:hypothetical protein
VSKDGTRIKTVELLSGKILSAKVFIDATYEGDLLARAGVSYAMAGKALPNTENPGLADSLFTPDGHNFQLPVSPFVNGKNGKLLPLINDRSSRIWRS